MSEIPSKLEAQAWDERYRQHKTGWDIGEPAPPFVDYFSRLEKPLSGEMLVPGCGLGNDALYFAEKGCQVLGVDFAQFAIDTCRERANSLKLTTAKFELHDVFDLGKVYPQAFDYVAEHTCYCAIDPARRPEYVQVIREVLRPNGLVIAIFFVHGRSGGPPFTTTPEEVREYFSPFFQIEYLEKATRSHTRRINEEYFGILRKVR